MKLIVTLDVPEDMERALKIADQIDNDWLMQRKIAHDIMATTTSRYDIRVEYEAVHRITQDLINRGR